MCGPCLQNVAIVANCTVLAIIVLPCCSGLPSEGLTGDHMFPALAVIMCQPLQASGALQAISLYIRQSSISTLLGLSVNPSCFVVWYSGLHDVLVD